MDILSGHRGEQPLDGTFVDYEMKPREYELSIAQTSSGCTPGCRTSTTSRSTSSTSSSD